ncbi:MAG: hypothetical protein WCP45_06755 [Verrucomicrobiota bacterium]
MFKFRCPACSKVLIAEPHQIGSNAVCPNCRTAVVVPPGGIASGTFQSNQPTRKIDTVRHWIIKIVLGAVILFLTMFISLLTHTDGSTGNWPVAAIGVAAFFALMAWKPEKRGSSTEIVVKPLNKRDDNV